jgi:hypothetical protein
VAPAVVGFNGHAYVAWTGTDSAQHINIIQAFQVPHTWGVGRTPTSFLFEPGISLTSLMSTRGPALFT